MPHSPASLLDDAISPEFVSHESAPETGRRWANSSSLCVADVVSPQSYVPNMIGDFFGTGGTSTISVDSFVSYAIPNYVGGGNIDRLNGINGGYTSSSFTLSGQYFADADAAGPLAAGLVEYPGIQVVDILGNELDYGPYTATQNGDTTTDGVTSYPVYSVFGPPIPSFEINGPIGAAPGANVGRQKLTENVSPIPRDRVFVNYSYFDNTPLYQGGVNVNRVTPGFEKTFLNGRASFEFRAPFATTLDSNISGTGITNTNNTEFGNITMYLKALIYNDSTWAFSTGLGVAIPTADNFNVQQANGSSLLQVDNQSVHVLPFLAGVYTPNSRFFAQGIVQVDVDTNGNPVSVSQYDTGSHAFTGDQVGLGRASDYTYLYLDMNAGYWVYQNFGSGRLITGLAPMAEMHINQTVGAASNVYGTVDGVNWNFTSDSSLTMVNGIVGMTAIVRDRATVTAGYCTPLGNDQAFDGELRLTFNWMFGNSRPLNPLARTPTF